MYHWFQTEQPSGLQDIAWGVMRYSQVLAIASNENYSVWLAAAIFLLA